MLSPALNHKTVMNSINFTNSVTANYKYQTILAKQSGGLVDKLQGVMQEVAYDTKVRVMALQIYSWLQDVMIQD